MIANIIYANLKMDIIVLEVASYDNGQRNVLGEFVFNGIEIGDCEPLSFEMCAKWHNYNVVATILSCSLPTHVDQEKVTNVAFDRVVECALNYFNLK